MKIDIDLLKEFERTIDTKQPEKGEIPIKILGYGEISLVFEIIGDPQQLAYKSDKKMWSLFQKVRKFHRFIKTKILRKQYPFYLPGKIER